MRDGIGGRDAVNATVIMSVTKPVTKRDGRGAAQT